MKRALSVWLRRWSVDLVLRKENRSPRESPPPRDLPDHTQNTGPSPFAAPNPGAAPRARSSPAIAAGVGDAPRARSSLAAAANVGDAAGARSSPDAAAGAGDASRARSSSAAAANAGDASRARSSPDAAANVGDASRVGSSPAAAAVVGDASRAGSSPAAAAGVGDASRARSSLDAAAGVGDAARVRSSSGVAAVSRARRSPAPKTLTSRASDAASGPPASSQRKKRAKHTIAPPPTTKPAAPALLIAVRDGQKRVVVACCDHAASRGIQPGLPLGEACALLPHDSTRIEPHNPDRDAAALRALAVWASRFSPVVTIDPPDGLLIDATGCAHVFGGEEALLARIEHDLAALGFACRAAIAPTFAAAWALARYAPRPSSILISNEDRAPLAELPVRALAIDEATIAGLDEIGVTRIGQLIDLPRRLLPARFGESLLLRLDQLLGRALEPIEPVRWREPAAADFVLDGPTTRAEDIERIVFTLVDQLCTILTSRDRAARRVELTLHRADLEPARIALTFARPSRDARHFRKLLRPRLEKVHLGFGVERITITAVRSAPITHEQSRRWSDGHIRSEAEAQRAIAEFVDAITNRLGAGSVRSASQVESHIPERAFRFDAASGTSPQAHAPRAPGDRPTILLDTPLLIDVISLAPDGAPHRIRARTEELEIIAAVGPERIAPEWWKGDVTTRDYFRIQTHDGRWLWVCHHIETARWVLHGLWA